MNNFDDILNTAEQEQKPKPKAEPERLSNEEYAEMKKAEREALFETSNEVAERAVSSGENFRQYLDIQARLNYSAVNTLLVMEVKPEATQLGDADYWNEKDCFIKAGEKGIAILEPHEYTKSDGTDGVSFNVKKVFDISQVDTEKLIPEPKHSFDNRQILRALVHKAPMTIRSVDEVPNGGGAMTDPKSGDILVLKDMAFKDAFRSVAHEMALAEVNYDKASDPQFTAYCASYILCKKYDVDTSDYNFDSVTHTLSDMEPKDIKSELSQVRKAADEVSSRMAHQLDSVQKAARDNRESR